MYKIYLPNKKRAFIEITTADNDWLVMNGEKTFNEFKKEYEMGIWFSNKDISIILETYIKHGYGNEIMGKYFR